MIEDIKHKFDELMQKDDIAIEDAANFLKAVNTVYIEERGKYLRNKQIKDAKRINDEMIGLEEEKQKHL